MCFVLVYENISYISFPKQGVSNNYFSSIEQNNILIAKQKLKTAVNGATNRYKVKSEKKRTGTWTEAEKDICRQWLNTPEEKRCSKKELAEKITNHTENGIKDMLRRLRREI